MLTNVADIKKFSVEPPWIITARSLLGELEIPGVGDNPEIVKMHSFTRGGPSPDAIAWCSSFACRCMEENGIESPKSKKARDWLKWGIKLSRPRYGCVVVTERSAKDNPDAAHVQFWLGIADSPANEFYGIGGNQNDGVTIKTVRAGIVLPGGYRWPANWPQKA